jgi:XTP/dITP diphosphohydrolase
MKPPELIVFGTNNRKKGVELGEVFAPVGIEVKTLADVPGTIVVDETGNTFRENATLKAVEQARHLKLWVLGEDSGLAVDALRGAPGVRSARFAGVDGDDAANNRLLLERLADVPLERRAAGYVSYMVLADADGHVRAESEGSCRGRIVFEPRGSGGFGYDPLFEVVEYHRTFGELSPRVKACLSHRARAARQLIPQLRRLLSAES